MKMGVTKAHYAPSRVKRSLKPTAFDTTLPLPVPTGLSFESDYIKVFTVYYSNYSVLTSDLMIRWPEKGRW